MLKTVFDPTQIKDTAPEDTPLFQTYNKRGECHAILCGTDITFPSQEDRFDFILDYLDLYDICIAKLAD